MDQLVEVIPLEIALGHWRRRGDRLFVRRLWHHAGLLVGGAVALCFVLRRVSRTKTSRKQRPRNIGSGAGNTIAGPATNHVADENGHENTNGEADFTPRSESHRAQRIAKKHRLTGRRAVGHGTLRTLAATGNKKTSHQVHVVRAIRQLDEAMALVPAGRVLLGQLAEQSNSACGSADIDPKLLQRNLVAVAPAYLDRFCVTNEQYQQFVDSGGYEQLEFWYEEALPALLDFVDQTGAPGPRFWSDGQYPSGEQRLPVVGISWYEARAYARWVGKRLPTDCRMDEGRRLAGGVVARPHRPTPLSVGRIVRRAPRSPVRLRPAGARGRR